jgi:prevent-host-death family protein
MSFWDGPRSVETVTISHFREHTREVIDQVTDGGPVIITRHGRPVAELRPIRPRGLAAADLITRWRHVPVVEPSALRRDIDRNIDQTT